MPLLAYYALWINGESGPAPRAQGNCRHSLFEVAVQECSLNFAFKEKTHKTFKRKHLKMETSWLERRVNKTCRITVPRTTELLLYPA